MSNGLNLKNYIFSEIINNYHQLQKKIHELKFLSIEITKRCNLQCRHCYMASIKTLDENEINTEEWKIFFSQIKNKFGNKIIINIRGGEPFIREDIFEIIGHLSELGFYVTISTNGSYLNHKSIVLLDTYSIGIGISLDGFSKSHNYLRGANVYNEIVNNIKIYKKISKKPLVIKTAVYKKNLNELQSMYIFLNDLKIDIWHIFAIEPTGNALNNKSDLLDINDYYQLCEFIDKNRTNNKNKIKIIFEEQNILPFKLEAKNFYKFKRCGAGINFCTILSNGDIVRCAQEERTENKIMGNILIDDFFEIWNNEFKESRFNCYKFCNNHYFINKIKNNE